jgi:hypothetical protein
MVVVVGNPTVVVRSRPQMPMATTERKLADSPGMDGMLHKAAHKDKNKNISRINCPPSSQTYCCQLHRLVLTVGPHENRPVSKLGNLPLWATAFPFACLHPLSPLLGPPYEKANSP